MKVIFLDIDGVLNTSETLEKGIYIDPERANLIKKILKETGAKIILSSTWRFSPLGIKAVQEAVGEVLDITPNNNGLTSRGNEIKQWLDSHPVEKYAIIDDNVDMLKEQSPHFFQCPWNDGITSELTERIIKHLNV